MHAQIHTTAFWGIETVAVTVQTYIANVMPAMVFVGLAAKMVRGRSGTSRRVKRRGAFRFTDCPWPGGGYGRCAARRG